MNADEYGTRQKLIPAEKVAFVDAHYYYRRVASSITQAFSTKSFDTLHTNKLLCELIEETYSADDDVVKTMRLQRLYDIVNKRIMLLRNRRKLSCEERQTLSKLIKENYNDIKLIYKPALNRFFIVSRYMLRKIYCFVTS